MKCFIWANISELTDRYHSNGGLVVVHETVEQAIKMAEQLDVKFSKKELEPDFEYELKGDVEPDIYIFPDSGCC